VVDGDIHALVAEVVGHRQALQASPVGKAVADEIHAPNLVDRASQLQRHPLVDGPLALLALAHSQVGLSVKTVHPLVVDARVSGLVPVGVDRILTVPARLQYPRQRQIVRDQKEAKDVRGSNLVPRESTHLKLVCPSQRMELTIRNAQQPFLG